MLNKKKIYSVENLKKALKSNYKRKKIILLLFTYFKYF